ncbi:pyruvate kinase [Pasteurella multocida]|uniref:pyruvate kinase n=1 Tax=Pasteurella multocida TaxID=747 RepID=UPI000BBD1C75|nr:pyruvate kinase [Pasteurella multocida]ATF73942.1 pyruvate kinase [Pasteurella multocida]ATN16344.1 pyruvate kinase [Pasteurella multocida]HDR1207951.1 pyruvate kinase [Pasteurella multocida]HDR1385948.1 pyruvate kinase [Pasteurella multocida]
MKEFDLEKALAGEPVVLRNGDKAFVKFVLENPLFEDDQVVGFHIDSEGKEEVTSWGNNGVHIPNTNSIYDIIGMWEEPRPTVTLTLPAPITYPEENKRCYTIVINDVDAYDGDGSFVSISDWVAEKENGDYDYQTKQRIMEGLLFATEEDAQAWLDAMKNARR